MRKGLIAGSSEVVASPGTMIVSLEGLYVRERVSAGLALSFPIGCDVVCGMTSYRVFEGSSAIAQKKARFWSSTELDSVVKYCSIVYPPGFGQSGLVFWQIRRPLMGIFAMLER